MPLLKGLLRRGPTVSLATGRSLDLVHRIFAMTYPNRDPWAQPVCSKGSVHPAARIHVRARARLIGLVLNRRCHWPLGSGPTQFGGGCPACGNPGKCVSTFLGRRMPIPGSMTCESGGRQKLAAARDAANMRCASSRSVVRIPCARQAAAPSGTPIWSPGLARPAS
jgi:hypothetical protein